MGLQAISRGMKAVLSLSVLLLLFAAPALAIDNPELLPDHPTPVIDLAKALSDTQRQSLETSLDAFEDRSGWKLRVLTCLLYTSDAADE